MKCVEAYLDRSNGGQQNLFALTNDGKKGRPLCVVNKFKMKCLQCEYGKANWDLTPSI